MYNFVFKMIENYTKNSTYIPYIHYTYIHIHNIYILYSISIYKHTTKMTIKSIVAKLLKKWKIIIIKFSRKIETFPRIICYLFNSIEHIDIYSHFQKVSVCVCVCLLLMFAYLWF